MNFFLCRRLISLNITLVCRVHYVRSYDLNMAVNIWWRHGVKVNFRNCDTELGTTIEDLTFIGFGALHDAQEKLIRLKLIVLLRCLFLLTSMHDSDQK